MFTFAGREVGHAPGEIFERFANGSPLTVMPRGTSEYALRPQLLNQLFAKTARRQYAPKLLSSTLVDLTSHVVCRAHRSHHAAYQAGPAQLGACLRRTIPNRRLTVSREKAAP